MRCWLLSLLNRGDAAVTDAAPVLALREIRGVKVGVRRFGAQVAGLRWHCRMGANCQGFLVSCRSSPHLYNRRTGLYSLDIIAPCQRARPTATIAREPKLMRFQPLGGQVGLALGAQQFGLARFW